MPTTMEELCNRLIWPRPMPTVVGLILQDSPTGDIGPLTCLDDVQGVLPDGGIVYEHSDFKPNLRGYYRITAVSPPPGTPVGRHDPIKLTVARIDIARQPPSRDRPCDWVAATEAATLLGTTTVETVTHSVMGDWDVICHYNSVDQSRGVVSELKLTGARVVDAASEFAYRTAQGEASSGVGIEARCVPAGPPNDRHRLYVLLPGEHIYVATGWGGVSCDILKQFAQAAIPRIGS
jgi:hypothetical protein